MSETAEKTKEAEGETEEEVSEPSGAELLVEYLQSEPGHKIADRLVTLFESKQKQAIEKGYKSFRHHQAHLRFHLNKGRQR